VNGPTVIARASSGSNLAPRKGVRIARFEYLVAALALVTVVAPISCAAPHDSVSEPPDDVLGARSDDAPRGEQADAATPDTTATPGDAEQDAAGNTQAGRDLGAALRSPPDVAPFHLIGRVDARDPARPKLGWPGTQLRARFYGTGVSLDLADTGASHYDVSIDGAPPVEWIVSGGRTSYDVASGLVAGEHDLVVTKRTETLVGVTQLFGVAPHPGGALIATPLPSRRRIELIGDSITCGFGVLGADETCQFSGATESEPLAWGALAAKELSAMHAAIAVSGLGVFRNYGGETEGTMPEVYGRAVATDPSSTWGHSFVADVIVVSLGTNDFAGGKGDPGVAFRDTYVTFLASLRAEHPNAQLVATTSPMLSGSNRSMLRAYLEAAVAMRVAAGESKLTLLEIDEQDFGDGLGCGYHPSTTTQQKMAARLVAHVRALMGW
jgi:lysophospholipase L1-like esterase